MGYGLKGKVKEIVTSMNAIRTDAKNPREVGLRTYIAEKFKDANGAALSTGHLLADIGVEPTRTKVHELMADEDNAYLMSEIIRDGVRQGMGLAQRELMDRARKQNIANLGIVTADGGAQRFMSPDIFLDPVDRGIVQGAFYPDLTIREENVSSPTVTVPKIELSDAELVDSAEAATIEEGTVTYGSKDVKLTKKARGLKVSYEAIQFNSLSLAQIYFRDAGRILGHTLNGMAVGTLDDGDVAGGSEAAAVIGVRDTDAGITWYDIARVALQGGLIGRAYSQVIGNATTSLDYLDMDEMKRMFYGTPLIPTTMRSPILMPTDLYASAKVAASQLIFNDPSASLVQLTAMPLMTETEKIISKQLEAAYVSIMTGFAKIQRTASIILDGSIAYTGNEFPTWMAPFAD